MPKMMKEHPPELICPHCKRRKRTSPNGYCDPCRVLLTAEGVIKPKRQKFMTRYKQYMTRANKGMTAQEIAVDLGLDDSYIYEVIRKAVDMGLPTPHRLPQGRPKQLREHGSGTQGLPGCRCEKCAAKRKEYKRDYDAKKDAARALRPKRTRTNHGEGSRGIENCTCDLCVQRRIEYKHDWREDVKKNGLRIPRRKASVAQPGSSS